MSSDGAPGGRVVMRHAVGSDADALAHVHHTGWLETYAALVPATFWETFTVERSRQRWHGWLQRGADATVAELDGAVVGFAMAGTALEAPGHPPVRELQLYSLYVLAAHHGTGTGQRLLDAVVEPEAPAQLWVAERNARARAFYRRNGFRPDGAAFIDVDTGIAEIRLVR